MSDFLGIVFTTAQRVFIENHRKWWMFNLGTFWFPRNHRFFCLVNYLRTQNKLYIWTQRSNGLSRGDIFVHISKNNFIKCYFLIFY